MKQLFFYAAFCVAAYGCCRHDNDQISTPLSVKPACLSTKIIELLPQACDDMRVEAYDFQGQRVYAIISGSCGADMTDEVVDSECNTLGYIGGFCGNVFVNGDDWSNAVFVATIWHR